MCEGLYGFLVANANDVGQSRQALFFLSSKNGSALGDSRLFGCNLRKSIALYCVRSLIKSDWINQGDVYVGVAYETLF